MVEAVVGNTKHQLTMKVMRHSLYREFPIRNPKEPLGMRTLVCDSWRIRICSLIFSFFFEPHGRQVIACIHGTYLTNPPFSRAKRVVPTYALTCNPSLAWFVHQYYSTNHARPDCQVEAVVREIRSMSTGM